MSRKADTLSKAPSWRARVGARSNRNPSACISVSQYRIESIISCRVIGSPALRELPQPVVS